MPPFLERRQTRADGGRRQNPVGGGGAIARAQLDLLRYRTAYGSGLIKSPDPSMRQVGARTVGVEPTAGCRGGRDRWVGIARAYAITTCGPYFARCGHHRARGEPCAEAKGQLESLLTKSQPRCFGRSGTHRGGRHPYDVKNDANGSARSPSMIEREAVGRPLMEPGQGRAPPGDGTARQAATTWMRHSRPCSWAPCLRRPVRTGSGGPGAYGFKGGRSIMSPHGGHGIYRQKPQFCREAVLVPAEKGLQIRIGSGRPEGRPTAKARRGSVANTSSIRDPGSTSSIRKRRRAREVPESALGMDPDICLEVGSARSAAAKSRNGCSRRQEGLGEEQADSSWRVLVQREF